MGRSGGKAKRKISSNSSRSRSRLSSQSSTTLESISISTLTSLSRSARIALERAAMVPESEGSDRETKLALLEEAGIDYKGLVLPPPALSETRDFESMQDFLEWKGSDFFDWENDLQLLQKDPGAQSMLLDPSVFDIEIESVGDFDFLSYKRKYSSGFVGIGFIVFRDKKIYAISEERLLDGYFQDRQGNLENQHHALFRTTGNGEYDAISLEIEIDDSVVEGYEKADTNIEKRLKELKEEDAEREASVSTLDKIKSGLSSKEKKYDAEIKREEEAKRRKIKIREEERDSFRDPQRKSITEKFQSAVLAHEKKNQKPSREEKKKRKNWRNQRRDWRRRRKRHEDYIRRGKEEEERRARELKEELEKEWQKRPITPPDNGGFGGGRPTHNGRSEGAHN